MKAFHKKLARAGETENMATWLEPNAVPPKALTEAHLKIPSQRCPINFAFEVLLGEPLYFIHHVEIDDIIEQLCWSNLLKPR